MTHPNIYTSNVTSAEQDAQGTKSRSLGGLMSNEAQQNREERIGRDRGEDMKRGAVLRATVRSQTWSDERGQGHRS